ncbi:oxidoreductase, partial [Candidatus Woesearchaeota archaeon]|nr:oxidoreductase [Candidatus Woesearchaeota archaeon]
ELVEIIQNFDILNFPMAQEINEKGPFDVTLVEGAVTTKKEIEKLKDIRKKSKIVIAFGTCATYGGIPAIKNFLDLKEVEEQVYDNPAVIRSIKATGIADHVKVDYFIRGCPAIQRETVQFLKDILQGKKPHQPTSPVCFECRAKGNECLLQKGQPCMGPITFGGCDALCPSRGIVCHGCRGPLPDANIAMEVKLFKKQGIKMKDIKRFFRMYAGTSRFFAKYLEAKK